MKNISCVICDTADAETIIRARDIIHRSTEKTFTYQRCRKCGLVYLNPRPEQNELKNFYPDSYRPHRKSQKENWHKYTPPENPSMRVLDAGCGDGSFLASLHEKNKLWELFGFDINERASSRARGKGFNVFTGDLFNAKYENDFFDRIYMMHFLEHVENPMEVLKEARRILKPGGILFIKVPNFKSFSRFIFGRYWFALDPPRHLFQFTPKTLRKAISMANLKINSLYFSTSPKSFLLSISYLISGKRWKYPKFVWQIFSLPAKIAMKLGWSSVMNIKAEKTLTY